MVFHCSLSDSKSPQVSRTLLSILAILNNAVIWMVSISPPTPKSSRLLNNDLVTVRIAPITIGIIVTFMFHSFFQLLLKVQVFFLLFIFFRFYSVVCRDSKVDNFVRSRAFVCGLSSPVLGLYSVGRLTSGRFCRVCLGTGDFHRLQGAILPGLYPFRRGFIAWRLRRPKKGIVDGAEGIFGLAGREWASALRPGPP